MAFFMLEAGMSTVSCLALPGIADAREHIGNGVGNLHGMISSLYRVTADAVQAARFRGQCMIARGLSPSFSGLGRRPG